MTVEEAIAAAESILPGQAAPDGELDDRRPRMMIANRLLWLVLLLVAAVSDGKASQEAVDVRIKEIAAIDPAQARQFLVNLKSGIRRDNRRSVCNVIEYPLRLQPGVTIRNASQCVQRYTEIFNKYVTDAVTTQQFGELFVNSGGIMIGRGQVWFGGICDDETCRHSLIRITDVNNREWERPPAKGRLLFTCHTDSERVEVVADGENGAVLRMWPRSRRASDPPGLELAKGVEDGEGSSGCAYSWWSFTSDTTRYVVSEIGCTEKRPPKNAIGTLTVNPDTPNEKTSWCID
jgi:hypothetical protein